MLLLDFWFQQHNTMFPSKAPGYRSPCEARKQMAEKTTETAVGAVRRPHEGAKSTEAIAVKPASPVGHGDAKRLA